MTFSNDCVLLLTRNLRFHRFLVESLFYVLFTFMYTFVPFLNFFTVLIHLTEAAKVAETYYLFCGKQFCV